MNCEPYDMAIVIRSPSPRTKHHLGMVVELTTLMTSWDGLPCWRLKNPFYDPPVGATLYAIADRDLKPLPKAKTVFEFDTELPAAGPERTEETSPGTTL